MHFKAALSVIVPATLQTLSLLAAPVRAVNLKYYHPAPGVSPVFPNFLEQFYTQAEATTSTSITNFEAYFATSAEIELGGQILWTGKAGAGTFKVAITGGNSFDHYPRTPSVVHTTSTNQTLAIAGSAKETYPNGTCVSKDYVTQWTVILANGYPVLAPEASEIVLLNLISQSPSAFGCDAY